jgi:hypothetical protein
VDTRAKAGPPLAALYALLNALLIGWIAVALTENARGSPRALYVALLFAICSSPLLLMRKLNDRYALCAGYLAIYFGSYGLLDMLGLASARALPGGTPILSAAELLILIGAGAFLAGYCFVVRGGPAVQRLRYVPVDLPQSTCVGVGLALYATGTAANWYRNAVMGPNDPANIVGSSGVVTLLMIATYALPVGLLMIAYAYSVSKSKLLGLVTIGIVCLQVVIGFVSNSKNGAMLGGVLVILAGVLVKGKIPKLWVLAGLAFVVFGFPVFQSYRGIVAGERGISSVEAARNIRYVLRLALDNLDAVTSGRSAAVEERPQTFLERASVKGSVEMIVSRTGKDVAYQHGYTLIPLATFLIPRILWRDKLDVTTGQLVDQKFGVTGTGSVYISPSHLGEVYWNFGWAGSIPYMLLLGAVLGWINRACDLSTGTSVTRFLILAVTLYQVGVRMEGTVAADYSMWIRSVIGILLLHWMLARRRRPPRAAPTQRTASGALSANMPGQRATALLN